MSNCINIVCGKFDNTININSLQMRNERIRIGSINPNVLSNLLYIPISTDGTTILYDNKLYLSREFISTYTNNTFSKFIVLTSKERELLLNILVDFDLDINVFEVKYPIFSHIKYISNIHKNYDELTKLLKIIFELNIKGKSLAHHLSTEYLFKIERKLRYKNKLDYFFAFAYKSGYSEVFKIKEEREDRVIIALDYNSMFVDSMMGEFIDPKSVKYKKFTNQKIDLETLANGLYRVILKYPKETFFKKFHPFKFVKLNQTFFFELEEDQCVEVLLFKNEISYYEKFFKDIEILEGFYSSTEIKHPLYKYAKNIYKERTEHKEKNNTLMDNLSKFKLITIHSATNSKQFKTLFFYTKEEIINYLTEAYMISFPKNYSLDKKLSLINDNKYFMFKRHKNGYKIKVINYDSYNSVFSLSSQILANSRLKMIQTIETFLLHNSVEICYINIDSIHISILKSEVDHFLSKHNSIISNKLGDLKIESISERGYWFDVGRYWLFSKNKVDIFKNSFFNKKGNRERFIKIRQIKFISKSEESIFSFVKTAYMSIFKSFSYNKKVLLNKSVDNINYKRYNYREICNLDVAEDSYNKEILKSKNFKINLYKKIATVKD